MVPSHVQIKTVAKVLLKSGVAMTNHALTDIDTNELTIEELYSKFASNLSESERASNILDLEIDPDALLTGVDEELPSSD